MHTLPFSEALAALAQGRLLIYPTETYFGLGCRATDQAAMAEVCRIKDRPLGKPLPLIVGGLDQLGLASPQAAKALEDPNSLVSRIAKHFWPGPLALLVEPASDLADQARGVDGLAAVRVTSHPVAARLCRELGAPIASTSANLSGKEPVIRPEDLDPELLERMGGAVLAEGDAPLGGEPSTLAALDPRAFGVWLLRHGAVTDEELRAVGVAVLTPDMI